MFKGRWVTSKYRQLRTACGQHADNIWLPRADPCLAFCYERELFRHFKSCLSRNVFQHLIYVQTKISSIMFHQSLGRVKALANEDTLLRTHCCPWCFLGCANYETLVVDTKCLWTKLETFLCPGHKICVRNKCWARGQTEKHLSSTICPQQFVLVCQRLKQGQYVKSALSKLLFWFSCIVHGHNSD